MPRNGGARVRWLSCSPLLCSRPENRRFDPPGPARPSEAVARNPKWQGVPPINDLTLMDAIMAGAMQPFAKGELRAVHNRPFSYVEA